MSFINFENLENNVVNIWDIKQLTLSDKNRAIIIFIVMKYNWKCTINIQNVFEAVIIYIIFASDY